MTTLNAYLERLYHTESEKTAATDLEYKFSKMSPDELLKIASSGDLGKEAGVARYIKELAKKHPRFDVDAPKAAKEFYTKDRLMAHNYGRGLARRGGPNASDWLQPMGKGHRANARDVLETASKKVTGLGKESSFDKAAASKITWADNWGRALAQMEKEAGRLDTMKESFDIGRHQNKVDRVRAILDLGPDTGGGFSGAPIPEAVAHHLGRHHRKYLAGAGLTLGGLALHRALKKDKPEAEKTSAAGCKTSDFTTPEAQEKAKVVQQALKSTKGAPAHVRKAAVKVTAEKLKQAGKA